MEIIFRRKTIRHFGALRLVILALLLLLLQNSWSQTHYYIRVDTLTSGAKLSLTARSAWTSNPSGAGSLATRPPGTGTFTSDNQIFHIQASGYTTSGLWRVSGANSKVVIGADTAVSFSTGNTLVAKFEVLNKATLVYSASRTDSLSFDNLAVGSTVRYAGSAIAPQNIVAANYYNLDCNQSSANSLPQVLPAGVVGVAGTFTRESASVPTNINRGTIDFNGTGGQVIPNFAYYNLTISGNKTVPDTLRGTAINVSGKFNPIATGAGYVTAATTVNFNGLSPQIIPAFNYNSITNSATGPLMYIKGFDYNAKTITLFTENPEVVPGLRFTTGSLLFDTTTTSVNTVTAVSGDVLTVNNAPKFKIFIKKPGATTIDSTYETAFSVADKSITVQNPSLISLGDTLRGAGALHINGATTATNYALAIGINGNVITLTRTVNNVINPYAGFIVFSSADGNPTEKKLEGSIGLTGSFTSNGGKYICTGSTVSYNGKRQTVSGLPYNHLIINQDSATTASVSTLSPASVEGTLTLQKGRLTTTLTTRKLTLGPNAAVVRLSDTAFINGPVYKQTASTNIVTIPLGKETSSTGIGVGRQLVLQPQTALPKTYLLEFFNAKALKRATPLAPLGFVDSVFFVVGLSAGTDSSAKLGFEYQFPVDVNPSLITTAYFDVTDSTWKTPAANGVLSAGATGTTGIVTASDYFNTFGRFAVGINIDPLPAVLTSFTAAASNDGTVALKWLVATQTNVSAYVIEKSTNGVVFQPIGSVAATSTLSYAYTDAAVAKVVYYRIKIVDKDGSVAYSSIKIVAGAAQKTLLAYPNPATNQLAIAHTKATDKASLAIYQSNGVLVKQLLIQQGTTQTTLNVAGWSKGNYTVKYFNGLSVQSIQLQKL